MSLHLSNNLPTTLRPPACSVQAATQRWSMAVAPRGFQDALPLRNLGESEWFLWGNYQNWFYFYMFVWYCSFSKVIYFLKKCCNNNNNKNNNSSPKKVEKTNAKKEKQKQMGRKMQRHLRPEKSARPWLSSRKNQGKNANKWRKKLSILAAFKIKNMQTWGKCKQNIQIANDFSFLIACFIAFSTA